MADEARVILDPQKLAELLRSPEGPVMREMILDADLVLDEAKQLVGVHTPDPWGRPTDRAPGTLRDSMVKRVVEHDGSPAVEVGSDDPIALLHHEGTEPHSIDARVAPRLVFWQGGTVVYAKHVNHPGTRPNRYLTNALEVLRNRY